jgi:eukaryotic-like serine/threonine-protein kinase
MNEESLFAAALEKAAGAERQGFLDGACASDKGLRRRVELLLAADGHAGGLLDREASGEAPATAEGPGTVIGRYKLREQIGEGGFGLVFVAEQYEPVRRKVALKVIKPGMDTREVVARFEAERQALALMDHPNIAKVLDAGAADSGRPYFVMELVRGVAVTEYCDRDQLTTRERLDLFAAVCRAVQHAHQKGVIHRDLKPTNVLVTLHDGKPVVKVIDFGVAKALNQQLTEHSVYTRFAQMVGTPTYMSPEQAEMSGLDIDTRADIYSLGVLLYELLTGTTPFDKGRLKTAGFDEIRRIIREEEPPKPSTRVSTLGQAATTVSANRQSDPRRLSRSLRGELDWVVMKALEKDRTRRYETAADLARDVERYLRDEPVEASPPSTVYRLRKVLRRNRGPVLAALVVLVALFVGIVAMMVGLLEAWRQRDLTEQARKDEAKQRLETEWLLYGVQINLAQQAWENDNAALAFHHLEACRPDFRGWEHDYLFSLFYSNHRTYGTRSTFQQVSKSINSVAVSPDGTRIAVGGSDRKVKVWETATGREIVTLPGHTNEVLSVAFSPDGKRVASGGADRTVRVWDADTGREILTFGMHTDSVTGVAFGPDGTRIASASRDGTVRVWDVDTGGETLTLRGRQAGITGVAWSPDGQRIAGCTTDHAVRVWATDTGYLHHTLGGGASRETAAAFSPDSRRIVGGGYDGVIRVWDLATDKGVLTLRGHAGAVKSVCFSPDGQRIASGGIDGTVRVWDPDAGREVGTLRGHTDQVSGVAFMPDGKHIISGSHDMTVKVWDAVWDPTVVQGTRTLLTGRGPVSSVAFSPDGKRAASGCSNSPLLNVWDAATGRELRTLSGGKGSVTGVAFSPDGTRIAGGNGDRTVSVLDAATGNMVLTLQGHTDQVYCVAWSPDGRRIASGGRDRTVRVWNADTGREVLAFPRHTDAIRSVAWSPDGGRIASGGNDQTVRVWDAATGQEALTLRGHAGPIHSVAWDPGGPRIASGSLDGTVKIWDAATGQEALTLRGHGGEVHSVAWSPDGRRIFSGSSDTTIKVWDAAMGHETLTLKAHTLAVTALAVSPDGRRILSGGSDGSVKAWDARMRQQQR